MCQNGFKLRCKQQFSTLAVRMPNRTRRPGTQTVRAFCPPPLPKTAAATPAPLVSEAAAHSPSEKLDNELKNLEHLSSLSSDEDEPGVCSHDLYKSSSTTLNTSDATSDKKKKTGKVLNLKFIIMAFWVFFLALEQVLCFLSLKQVYNFSRQCLGRYLRLIFLNVPCL